MHTDLFAIVDFSLQGARRRLMFAQPREVIVAANVSEVRGALRVVEAAAMDGCWAVGYIGYEAAPAFDPAFQVRAGGDLPPLCFGIFDTPPKPAQAERSAPALPPLDWQPSVDRARYNAAIASIRSAIGAGDTYQVNYTLRLRAAFEGDDLALYNALHAAQPAPYSAYLNTGHFRVLSLSPELFFQRSAGQLVAKPMKGTAPRGRWPAEDDEQASGLAASAKNRAENLMIVDLLRNDLGRVAQIGSVRVPELFAVERYPTVLQMTSTVTASERPGTTLEEIVAALFPCGSITGAPKISTMRLIASLEDSPRELYCGAIGVVQPGGDATFNVAIRTLLIDTRARQATYGVGGGITWDSTADDEYAEALAKAAVLRTPWRPFALLETMRLKRGRYALLPEHMRRLADSARFFDISLDVPAIHAQLEALARIPQPAQRVRLLVEQNGASRLETAPLAPLPAGPQRVALAQTPVSSAERWLFHKTTARETYEQRRAERPDVFDVLLLNERGELTEFTIGNLVLELGGVRYTPPIASGLLGGTLRAALLRRGSIHERVLTPADLQRATRLWLINSVRGWLEVRLDA